MSPIRTSVRTGTSTGARGHAREVETPTQRFEPPVGQHWHDLPQTHPASHCQRLFIRLLQVRSIFDIQVPKLFAVTHSNRLSPALVHTHGQKGGDLLSRLFWITNSPQATWLAEFPKTLLAEKKTAPLAAPGPLCCEPTDLSTPSRTPGPRSEPTDLINRNWHRFPGSFSPTSALSRWSSRPGWTQFLRRPWQKFHRGVLNLGVADFFLGVIPTHSLLIKPARNETWSDVAVAQH